MWEEMFYFKMHEALMYSDCQKYHQVPKIHCAVSLLQFPRVLPCSPTYFCSWLRHSPTISLQGEKGVPSLPPGTHWAAGMEHAVSLSLTSTQLP